MSKLTITRPSATLDLNEKSTGLLWGGVVTINAVDSTLVDITAGAGYIVDHSTVGATSSETMKYVQWNDMTGVDLGVTFPSPETHVYVVINANGQPETGPDPETNISHKLKIYLSRLEFDTLGFDYAYTVTDPIIAPTARIADLARALGAINIEGNKILPFANDLRISKNAGRTYSIGANYHNSKNDPDVTTDLALIPATFEYVHRGTNGWDNYVTIPATQIDSTAWDDGSGVLPSVPQTNNRGYWTVQIVWHFAGSNILRIEYGQKLYSTREEALASIPDPDHENNPEFGENGVIRCYLGVEEGNLDLSDPTKAFFVEGAKFGASAGGQFSSSATDLQTAYTNSTEPEILTDDVHGAITVQAGIGTTSNLYEGNNESSVRVFTVTNTGALPDTSIEDLGDVVLTSPAANQILSFDGTNWVNINSSAGITTLDGLVDTNIITPGEGQVLTYSGGQWTNQAIPGFGSPATWGIEINDITDVTTAPVPSVGQVLTFDGTQWVNADPVGALVAELTEPTGYVDRDETTIDFDPTTRTFTIAPRTPVHTEFRYYIGGVKHIVSTSKSIQIPDVNGMHFIYLDANEDIQIHSGTFESWLIMSVAYTAVVYWNSALQEAVYFADERHGITMDGDTHAHFHLSLGTLYITGLGTAGITIGDGNSDAHAVCAIGNGTIRDEDKPHDIVNTGTKVNSYDLEQQLDPVALIPVVYRTGPTATWAIKVAPTNFPIIHSGDGSGYVGAINGLPAYNEFDGATWRLTEVANNRYFFTHLLATNDARMPIIAVAGTGQYQNRPSGQEEARSEFASFSGLPFAEFYPIATIIYQAATGFANTPKARIVQTAEGTTHIDWRDSEQFGLKIVNTLSDHGNLVGLADDDHPQYARVDGTRTFDVEDLENTTITAPTAGQALVYNGAGWSNAVIDGSALFFYTMRHNGAVTQTFDVTPIAIDFSNAMYEDTSIFNYVGLGAVEISEAGVYQLTYDVTYTSTGNTTTGSETYVAIDGVAYAGSQAYGQHRSTDGFQTISATVIFEILAGSPASLIEIMGHKYSGADQLTSVENGCRLKISKIK